MTGLFANLNNSIVEQAAIVFIVLTAILLFVGGMRFFFRLARKILRFSLMLLFIAGGVYLLLHSLQIL